MLLQPVALPFSYIGLPENALTAYTGRLVIYKLDETFAGGMLFYIAAHKAEDTDKFPIFVAYFLKIKEQEDVI